MPSPTSRRQFLNATLAVGASAFAAPAILRAAGLNEKLHIGVIGCGGRGGANMSATDDLTVEDGASAGGATSGVVYQVAAPFCGGTRTPATTMHNS